MLVGPEMFIRDSFPPTPSFRFFFFFVSLEVRFSTRDQYPASSPLARFAYATQFPKNVEKSPFTNQSL